MVSKGNDRVRGRSRVDLYLPHHLIDEVLAALQPVRASARPHQTVSPKQIVAEPLAGGCQLYRLPRAGR
jgi:hypothetical protein